MNFNKFSFIWGIIIIITFLNVVNAKKNNKLTKEKKVKKIKDQNYLVFIENNFGEIPIFSEDVSKFSKRQESNEFVESLVDKIHNIIVNNKDTYQQPEKLEEIEKENLQFKKRNDENKLFFNNWNSDFVYPISSVYNTTVLLAYLSQDIVKNVESLKYVVKCIPDISIKPARSTTTNYNINDIKEETKWKGVKVQKNAPNHLSLLSQGIYHKNSEYSYDTNYYYPSSAGKDIDIVILDSNFNFMYNEFSNTNDRTVKCMAHISKGKANTNVSEHYCGGKKTILHGEPVADVAAGLTYGVAKRANVYAVSHDLNADEAFEFSDCFSGLQYALENLIRPHKTVVNYSITFNEEDSEAEDEEHEDYYTSHFRKLTQKITEKGGIVVSAAGNEGNKMSKHFRSYPCYFDHVICAGGIDDNGFDNDIDPDSNFGAHVNIYAPFNVEFDYKAKNNKVIHSSICGTSFSTPITTGVIATIMGENPNIKFTTQSMIQYLKKIGISDKSKRNKNMSFIKLNNGKKSVPTSTVSGRCGPKFGACSKSNQCCSKYGYCGTTTEYCGNGCQSEFGKCSSNQNSKTTTTTKEKKKIVSTVTKSKPKVSTTAGRCGPEFGTCSKANHCCSKYGYCGTTTEYCGNGCQSGFGICK